jgi:capsular polysaccharide biosynthesis protein
VMGRVVKRLGAGWTVASLSDRIHLSVPTSARVFALSFTGRTPEEARRGAATVADEYVRQRSGLIADRTERVSSALRDRRADLQEIIAEAPAESGEVPERSGPSALPVDRALRAQIRTQIAAIDKALTEAASTTANAAEIVQPARLPTAPTRTNAEVAPVSGLMSGLAAGLGLGYLRRRRRRCVEDAYDVGEVAGLPILARIGSGPLSADGGSNEADRASADNAVRRLAAQIAPALADGTGRVVVLGCCADSLVTGFVGVLQRALTSSTTGSAYDPEVVVAGRRAGSRTSTPHPESADVVVVLVEFGGTTRGALARAVHGLRGRAQPAGAGQVTGPVMGIVTLVPAGTPPGTSGHTRRGTPG